MVIDLGTQLRTWRERVQPDAVGLPAQARRRTSGLRREEVAQLAGVSTDYIVRLEQGRSRHPSAQVLHALARALRLDDEERERLYRMAGLLPPTAGRMDRRISPSALRMVERLGDAVTSVDETRLEDLVVELLRAGGLTVAVVETVSAGRLDAALSARPGASDVLRGGLVAGGAGVRALGLVPDSGGETSTTDLAVAVRERFGADVGLAVTGAAPGDVASDVEPELPYMEFGTAEVSAGGLSSIMEVPIAVASDSMGPGTGSGESLPAISATEGNAGATPAAGSYMNV